ncbi:MAG: hypothetical protein JJLCMIEE_02710 [Acidimicrobiales bacterium]|nr:hypothetical protein [Acidimicrobiales bacterium]
MWKWIAATMALLALVGAVAVVTGAELINKPPSSDMGECQTEAASASQGTVVVLIGTNASDATLEDIHLRHLQDVVLPDAARNGARVIEGTISNDSERDPTLVADISFMPTGEGSDNPENQVKWADDQKEMFLRCTRNGLVREPADRSDVFGAISWASSLLPERAEPRRIVVLSDAINTTEGCNLTGRDIVSSAGRAAVMADCGGSNFTGLAGTEIWLGGVGMSSGGDSTGTRTPSQLEDFWSWFIAEHRGRVTRAGTTLLPEG